MFTYNISKNADIKVFAGICSFIESNINIEKREDCLIDVDGSQVQIYKTAEGNIKVFNDYEVDAVYIDSEVDLYDILVGFGCGSVS